MLNLRVHVMCYEYVMSMYARNKGMHDMYISDVYARVVHKQYESQRTCHVFEIYNAKPDGLAINYDRV